MARILLIDDDPEFREFLRLALVECGHRVDSLDGAERGPELLAEAEFDLVLLDNKMPGMSGLDFLAATSERGLSVPVILMTGDPSSDTTIQAMNLGAFDYVVKPLDIDEMVAELEPSIAKAEDIVRSMREHVRLPDDPTPGGGPQLLGRSKAMRDVYKRIGMVAGQNVPVLILGETGTGKELIARAVHSYSPRQNRPFVAMNCTALSEGLLDSELFGYEKGAFTGADKLRKGKFEYAHTGTLFLDELGDMPAVLQAKLLRVLESQEIVRIGGNETIAVDVRIVSATHRDLESGVEGGAFRLDLLTRLGVFPIVVPPLRERGEDLRLLTEHFLQQAARRMGRPVPTLHASAWARLCDYPWPGNVRELRNVIERAVVICRGPQIGGDDIEFGVSGSGNGPGNGSSGNGMPADGSSAGDVPAQLRSAVRSTLESGRRDVHQWLVEALERELIRQTLAEYDGNRLRAAERLGKSRGWLLKMIAAYGLE